MAGFLVFLFLLNLLAGFNIELPSVAYGETVPILSIDGGGIKGIIPAVVLEHLEQALQEMSNDKNARIAEYFDVVAGTSTGGLMTAMLTAPNPHNTDLPLFTAKEIVEFYKKECPYIFNQTTASGWNVLRPYPKYDGVYLHNITREYLKETRLEETLTKVVIPTFDLQQLKPVIFSSFKTNKSPDLNALLSDIVISTSAAPTYLPSYYFKNGDTEFNMIDGGAAAGNPTLVAISEVAQEEENTQFLLLSLGTGTSEPRGWNTTTANQWNAALDWSKYSLGIASSASTDMIEYYITTVFQAQHTLDNYLRIEEYNLPSDNAAMDNATTENLEALEKIGRDLLNEPVKRVNINTFVPTDINEGTNAEALNRLAERLYELKQQRLAKRSLGKKGARKIIKEKGTRFAFQ